MTDVNLQRPATEVVEGIDLEELLTEILSSMNEIQDRLEAIQETQAEVIEKLDNLGVPGSGFEVDYES